MSFIVFIISFCLYFLAGSPVLAITDPLTVPNNKVGIHILFPGEIERASKLVNNSGQGQWGYVTIPIQASDRDRIQWQQFFDDCKKFKVIPIIRVATVPEGSNWAQPNNYDLVDFANFLGDLNWPTENRYIIIFNEVNRADEFGGYVSPENYSDILSNAIDIFKAVSPDFFILPAGLDNAATNSQSSLNWRLYLERMYLRHPDIFNKIDGWTSHAYPNPDFNQRADKTGPNKIDSFLYDLRFIRLFSTKKLPVFITETGWSTEYLSEHQISLYYQYAFVHPWANSDIVAITPFLLNAQDGPFAKFSFLNAQSAEKEYAQTLSSFATQGEPKMAITETATTSATPSATVKITPTIGSSENSQTLLVKLYNSFMSLLKLFGK